jgi:hypothetical protein
MPEAPQTEPEWVQRMRAAGYNIRVGTINEPLSEVPEVMFPPPVSVWRRRFGGNIIRGIRNALSRASASSHNGRHAHLP